LLNRKSFNRKNLFVLLSISLVFVSISISWLPVSADDTDPPSIEDIKVKPKNKLELGDTPFFEIKVEDPSGINQVLVEYEGANHTMEKKNGVKWIYDCWTPTALGIYIFTIHAEDMVGNWAQANDFIEIVLDATPPDVVIVDSPIGEIVGGKSIIISAFVNDTYEINQVLFEFEDVNASMVNFAGTNRWDYELIVPVIEGVYSYTIYAEDVYHNWNTTTGSIEVIDGTEGHSNIWGVLSIIGLLIGVILSVSLVVASKFKGDERSIRSKLMARDQSTQITPQETYPTIKKVVEVRCPTCYKRKDLPVVISIRPKSGGLCTVFVPRNVICEHSFHMYVDRLHAIRGYESVDYSVGEDL